MNVLQRLFPAQLDNRFDGHRAALWLFGVLIALKLVVSLNSILNTASVAAGADGIPLDSYGAAAAREVVMLFSLNAVGPLMLALIGLVALIRYRALVPLLYLMSLGEQLARRLIVQAHAVARPEASAVAWYVTYGLLAVVLIGLLLSLLPARGRRQPVRAS